MKCHIEKGIRFFSWPISAATRIRSDRVVQQTYDILISLCSQYIDADIQSGQRNLFGSATYNARHLFGILVDGQVGRGTQYTHWHRFFKNAIKWNRIHGVRFRTESIHLSHKKSPNSKNIRLRSYPLRPLSVVNEIFSSLTLLICLRVLYGLRCHRCRRRRYCIFLRHPTLWTLNNNN